jgi:hypothetical protein
VSLNNKELCRTRRYLHPLYLKSFEPAPRPFGLCALLEYLRRLLEHSAIGGDGRRGARVNGDEIEVMLAWRHGEGWNGC